MLNHGILLRKIAIPEVQNWLKGPFWTGFLYLWVPLVIGSAVYCHLHGRILEGEPLGAVDSLLYGLRCWGPWLLVSPVVYGVVTRFQSFRKSWTFQVPVLLVLCAGLTGLDVVLVVVFKAWWYEIPITWPGMVRTYFYDFPKGLLACALVIAMALKPRRKENQLCAGSSHAFHAPEQTGDPVREQETPEMAPPENRLLVQTARGHSWIQVQDILWVGSAANYLEIHTADQIYMLRNTMKALSAQLDPDQFKRIHRSSLVNLDAVREVIAKPQGDHWVHLTNGHRLVLSKTYRDSFLRPHKNSDKEKPSF